MATIPDSVKAQLDADWTGAGGAEPTYYVEEDFRTKPPLGQDAIWIMSRTLDTGARPINDTFVTEEHVLELVVNTQTSADRLKEISDEVVRILNATAITDITYQRMKSRHRNSGELENIWVYQEVITYDLKQQMKSSTAAYGAGATGPFAVVGDLTVSGDSTLTGDLTVKGGDADDYHTFTTNSDIPEMNIIGGGLNKITSDDATWVRTQWYDAANDYLEIGYIKSSNISRIYCPDMLHLQTASTDLRFQDSATTIDLDQIADLLMFGSANAAYVPCVPVFYSFTSYDTAGGPSIFRNTGADDVSIGLVLPMPTVKGGLKLYVTAVRLEIADADDGDEVTRVKLYIVRDDDTTLVINDGTAREAPGTYEYSPYNQDCSAHTSVMLYVDTQCTNAFDLEIQSVAVKCYYAA